MIKNLSKIVKECSGIPMVFQVPTEDCVANDQIIHFNWICPYKPSIINYEVYPHFSDPPRIRHRSRNVEMFFGWSFGESIPFLSRSRGPGPRIRDVSGLLCALQAEGDRSLNAKLKSAGQKPFHWQTLQVGVWPPVHERFAVKNCSCRFFLSEMMIFHIAICKFPRG